MLKSYKKLDRWYDPLEPEGLHDTDVSVRAPESGSEDVPEADDGPARYPDYIAEAGSASARQHSAPAELSGRRTEFTGGWSDWVDAPDDDDRDADLVRLPWADSDEELAEPARIGRTPVRPGDTGPEPGARRRRAAGVLLAAVVLLGIATAVILYLLAPGVPGAGGAGADRDRGVGLSSTSSTGAAADMAVALDVPVPSFDVIPAGIDSVAPGTASSRRTMTVADDRYPVEATEFRSGGDPTTHSRHAVTISVIGGRTLTTGISAG